MHFEQQVFREAQLEYQRRVPQVDVAASCSISGVTRITPALLIFFLVSLTAVNVKRFRHLEI